MCQRGLKDMVSVIYAEGFQVWELAEGVYSRTSL